jgi:Arc/MetJ-type ribon-helix-helix transcriptional regulator
MAAVNPTSVRLPRQTLDALDEFAERTYRDRSDVVRLAVDEFLKQRASVTGASRLRDLERVASQHTQGDPMIDDGSPRPVSTGPETGPDTPAPLGLGTNDATLSAINSGGRQQISRDANDANRGALADHLARTGGKPWSVK